MKAEFEHPLPDHAVAVVSMVGRFPGASDPESLWANVIAGREGITFFSDDDIDSSVASELRSDAAYVRAKGLLPESDCFDAGFFGISPLEARIMDPQHRVLLELAWAALERSGHRPSDFAGNIGVYVGANWNRYRATNVAAHSALIARFGELNTAIANEQDFLATRISYKLDLKGPSSTVSTACSTSLVAITQAVRALISGDCDLALAGGVSISTPIKNGYLHQSGGMLSSDGHCRPFDAECSGTTFNDGAGLVALRRLQDAIDDGDHIHAVIRGCATGNDGANKVSFTAPSVAGQASVLTAALENAQVDPATVGYIEAHGTATQLGDPIEFAALNRSYGGSCGVDRKCALGSVKSSVGHLVHAAGVTGFIMAVLAVENGVVPPTLFYTKPNPLLRLDRSRFWVSSAPSQWVEADHPRRAGVSSFGVGGTNAHVVIEQAPLTTSPGGEASHDLGNGEGPHLLCVSAKTESSLARQVDALAQLLSDSRGTLTLPSVAKTLQSGRVAMRYRSAIAASSLADSVSALRSAPLIVDTNKSRRVAFQFPGYGCQQSGMARWLYLQSAAFRSDLDNGITLVLAASGIDIRTYLLEVGAEDGAASVDVRTKLPALFVFLHSLAVTFEDAGVRAETLIGCSLGEFVAGVVGGVLSFEDAIAVVVASSAAAFDLPIGGMLTVLCSESEARAVAADDVSVAAVHAENIVVLSGTTDAVEASRIRLEAAGVVTMPVASDRAFHSAMVDPIASKLEQQLSSFTLNAPQRRIVSSISGDDLTTVQAKDPGYWARILSRPVRFADALRRLGSPEDYILVEVGPGTGLTALALVHPEARTTLPVAALPSGGTDRLALSEVQNAVAHCWLHGASDQISTAKSAPRVPLPTYCFERERHWLEPVGMPPEDQGSSSDSLRAAISRMQAEASDSPGLSQRLGVLKALIEQQIVVMRSQLKAIEVAEGEIPFQERDVPDRG